MRSTPTQVIGALSADKAPLPVRKTITDEEHYYAWDERRSQEIGPDRLICFDC